MNTSASPHRRQPEDGYRIAGLRAILADREAELLALKGPCSTRGCRLHYAHSGPCDVPRPSPEQAREQASELFTAVNEAEAQR